MMQVDPTAFDALPAKLQSEIMASIKNSRHHRHHHHSTNHSSHPARRVAAKTDAVSFWKSLNLGGRASAHPRGGKRASPARDKRGRMRKKGRRDSPRKTYGIAASVLEVSSVGIINHNFLRCTVLVPEVFMALLYWFVGCVWLTILVPGVWMVLQDPDLNPLSASQVDPSCLASLPVDIQASVWLFYHVNFFGPSLMW